MKYLFCLCWVWAVLSACTGKESSIEVLEGHPRLLMLAGEERTVREKIAANPFLGQVHDHILASCEEWLDQPDPVRRIEGDVLLGQSRKIFRQVYFLSYAWRMTGEERYAHRAERIMLAAARFEDWHPSHFLDAAEMTMALAIGYDWLYDRLPDSSRRTIREAILEKGIAESFPETATDKRNCSWLKKKNNWNAVCNTGMAFGALATWEDNPGLSERVVCRAVKLVRDVALREYLPDGNYPEGYTYWNYGTGFAVMLIDALEKAVGSSFGMTGNEGFMRSPYYMLYMTTQNLDCFRYADCNLKGVEFSLPVFWFARRTGDKTMLWREMDKIDYMNGQGEQDHMLGVRYLPSLMLWAPDDLTRGEAPSETVFVGQGRVPVALLRNRWGGDNEIFLGLKGGLCEINHAHMDIGSFVMSVGRTDWVVDMGAQGYHTVLEHGIALGDRSQYSSRWEPFRWSPRSHNIMMFSDSLQRVRPVARIDRHGEKAGFIHAVTDLSRIDSAAVRSHLRGVAIADDAYVVVRDEVVNSDRTTPLRWAILTPSEVTLTGPNSALLVQGGERLRVVVEGEGVSMAVWPTTPPPHFYDEPEPGTVMVGFTATLTPSQKASYTVYLVPEKAWTVFEPSAGPLETW